MPPTPELRPSLRVALVVVCVAGTVLFASAFVATFVARPTLERAAREYLVAQVQELARQRFDSTLAEHPTLRSAADTVAKELSRTAQSVSDFRDSDLPEQVGAIIAALCAKDCEQDREAAVERHTGRVRAWADRVVEGIEAKLSGLREFVVGHYRKRLAALIHEVRIFTGINATLFLCTGALLWWRRNAMAPLLVPLALLTASTGISAWLYLSTQNWLWTVLLSDYVGWWYAALVIVVGAFLVDIVFNRARVSINIVTSLPGAIVPC